MKFNKIKKIQKVESEPIYHLTVEKNHNFFANNICVHNCDYRGEIGVILINLSNEDFKINNGDRICQMVINKYEKALLFEVDNLLETER